MTEPSLDERVAQLERERDAERLGRQVIPGPPSKQQPAWVDELERRQAEGVHRRREAAAQAERERQQRERANAPKIAKVDQAIAHQREVVEAARARAAEAELQVRTEERALIELNNDRARLQS